MLGLYVALVLAFVALLAGMVWRYKERYQPRDPILYDIRDNLAKLSPEARRLEFFQDDKSYTINKQRIHLCLKDERQQYYPMNMLMYVAIHELAHVLCDEIGHTPKFHDIFSTLLRRATELDIYDPNIPILQNYCGYTNESFVMTVNPFKADDV